MQRRTFLKTSAAASLAGVLGCQHRSEPAGDAKSGQPQGENSPEQGHLTYASPLEAMKAPPEKLAYVTCTYAGTETNKPDYLATVDLDPKSKTYCQIVHRTSMPTAGDELHHFGWNACSSCFGKASASRRYLVVPGLVSGRIHIIDTIDAAAPKMHKVIEADEIKKKTKLSAPHTVHCLADGTMMISMLGSAEGEGPGGFMVLDEGFNIVDNWTSDLGAMKFNYDYWYQPRHNVMVSSEWGAPNTVRQGFNVEHVKQGRYGQQLHFWDWEKRQIDQTVDLGAEGMIPLEVRFHHNPASTHGFVGAALSSSMWHWHKGSEKWEVEKAIQVDPVEVDGWPFPVPGLITDLVLSLDDRYLYFSNWLHGDIRQYDVSDPAKPKLTGRLWLGGVLKRSGEGDGEPAEKTMHSEHQLYGGPQMLQLSLDGKRLYVTNSLYSPWDDQFYPDIGKRGSYMLQLDCNTESGGLSLNKDFYVDFGAGSSEPIRSHEMRFPNGDCTSDIWV
jgi:selenium-binding protein 1